MPVFGVEGDEILLKKPIDVRRVVNDFVVPAELRELVPDLMETVRAARDYRRHRITIQRLDRGFGEHLIEVFVAHPARRVAMAVLFLAEDRKANAARLEDARERDRDSLRAVVERTHAANPEQDIRTLATLRELSHRGNVETIGP